MLLTCIIIIIHLFPLICNLFEFCSITYWNLALLTPNMLFFIFLAYHVGLFCRMFQQHNFPVVKALLTLVNVVLKMFKLN